MRVVLEKVRKNKSRVQKPPSAKFPETTSGPSSWKERFHMPKQLKQIFKKKGEQGEGGGGEGADDINDDDDDEPLLQA